MAAKLRRKVRPRRSSHKSDHLRIGNKLTTKEVGFFHVLELDANSNLPQGRCSVHLFPGGNWCDWVEIDENMTEIFVIVSICENICCGFVGLRGRLRPVILISRFIAVQ